jgi:hypothetical protein
MKASAFLLGAWLSLSVFAEAPKGDSSDTKYSIIIQLVGQKKYRPGKGEGIILSPTGELRDLDAHEYSDANLRRLLRSDNLLGEDKVRYLEVSASEVMSLETIRRVSARIRRLADPKRKTVVTIIFYKILIEP